MSYPCPCCGHVVFREPPGSYDICPVCFWEDDVAQLRWPDIGGANMPLIESQRHALLHGASEMRLVQHVRPPNDDELVEPGWRPVDLAIDTFESVGRPEADWPE